MSSNFVPVNTTDTVAAQAARGLGRLLTDEKIQRIAALAGRGDSADTKTAKSMLQRFQALVDQRMDGDLKAARRNDNLGASGGVLSAGALRHIYSEVLTEARPEQTGLTLFPVDTSVPLGSRSHEVQRVYGVGDARVWRGANTKIPTVQMGSASETFKVQYYVTSVVWDFFEELSVGLADIGQIRILMEIAREVLNDFLNDKVWFGDDALKIYGVLNYPWVTRAVLNGNWYGSPAQTEAYIEELARITNYAFEASRTVFRPTDIAISPRMYNWLTRTKLKDTGTLTLRSLMEDFLATSPFIRSLEQVHVAHELQDAFGTGLDGVLVYRADLRTIANVIPGGSQQVLPLIDDGIVKQQPIFIAHGGIVMRDVGNVLVAVARAAA